MDGAELKGTQKMNVRTKTRMWKRRETTLKRMKGKVQNNSAVRSRDFEYEPRPGGSAN